MNIPFLVWTTLAVGAIIAFFVEGNPQLLTFTLIFIILAKIEKLEEKVKGAKG